MSNVIQLHAGADNSIAQDYSQTATYIHALTGEPVETAQVWFRAIHDIDKSVPARKFYGTLAQHWQELCAHNTSGYGVFVNINAFSATVQTHNLTDVGYLRAHVIDLDNPLSSQQNYERAAASNPPPSFAVQSSPAKFHCYWVTQNYQGNERYTTLQRKLRQVYDSDRAIVDPTRVLRVPGFLHMKNPVTPHMVTTWPLAGAAWRYTIEQMEAAYQHVNVIDGQGGRHKLGDVELSAPSLEWLRFGLSLIDPNELPRHEWVSVTAAFKQAGWRHADEPTLFEAWSQWCGRFLGNDDVENLKQWRSIRETEVGWKSFLRKLPQLRAATMFGRNGNAVPVPKPGTQDPVPNPMTVPEYLDGFSPDAAATTTAATLRKMHELRIPLAYDEFAMLVLLTSPVPWEKNGRYPRRWTDNDMVGCKAYLESYFLKPSKETVNDAAVFIARRNGYHPVRNYVRNLTWDGEMRLDALLPRYFGTADDAYAKAVGKRFMIGAIARVMRPGCKLDTLPILEGLQGTGKSTALKILAGEEWFGDQLPDIARNNDAMIYLSGKWFVEIAELSAFSRAESNRIKSFVSSATDSFRAPYAKTGENHPRQSVFVGSTNDEGYLRDQTGNRRYWPVKCGRIDTAALTRDRDQLWAEARFRFDVGESWWLADGEEQLAAAAQEDRREQDAWEERVRAFVATLNGAAVSLNTVASIALGIPTTERHTGTDKRIANCLRAAGYERQRRWGPDGKRFYQYELRRLSP
ncbi:VapE domain-containing protein [Rhizobium sp. Root1220]|uniref:VapE domain-containing protein n=1 Tax=Rhizobium sp. Root1220 TaxID=1736432 RepID=UPI0006FD2FF5|nr:VapE domain-containing protein [Rhizobium sp. Root1220]KQV73020.1 hypothetical protein ASC90_06295 [Rhizobium sp. Root1220]